jgi:hypothetical protein
MNEPPSGPKVMAEFAAKASEKNSGFTRTWTASLSYKDKDGRINFSTAELASADLMRTTMKEAIAEAAEYVRHGFSDKITVQLWKTTKARGTECENLRYAEVYLEGPDVMCYADGTVREVS